MSNRNIKIGAILSYLAIAFNIIAGIIYTPWMIKMIGDSDYGIYTLALSVINFFLLDFGLSSAITKFISKYKSEGKKEKINCFLGVIFKLYFMIDLLILIILFIFYFLVGDFMTKLTPTEIDKFKVVFVIVGLYSVISFPLIPLNGIISSYEKFILLKSLDFIQKIMTVTLIVIGIILGGRLYLVVIINSFVSLIISFIKLIYIKRNLNIKIRWKYRSKELVKTVFSFSIWITIISLASRFSVNLAPAMLGRFSGTESITFFSIAYTIEGYIYIIANALNGLFLPKITKLVVEKKENNVFELMIKVGRIQTMLLGCIVITFLLVGKDFMNLWMGEEYGECYLIVLFMIIPDLFLFSMYIANNMLIVKDMVRYRGIVCIISGVFCLIALLILVPLFGATGAGFAIGISWILIDIILMMYVYQKYLKFNMKKFMFCCYTNMIVPTVLTIILGCILNLFFHTISIQNFIIKSIFIVIFYCATTYVYMMNNNEKSSISFLFYKFLNAFKNTD